MLVIMEPIESMLEKVSEDEHNGLLQWLDWAIENGWNNLCVWAPIDRDVKCGKNELFGIMPGSEGFGDFVRNVPIDHEVRLIAKWTGQVKELTKVNYTRFVDGEILQDTKGYNHLVRVYLEDGRNFVCWNKPLIDIIGKIVDLWVFYNVDHWECYYYDIPIISHN